MKRLRMSDMNAEHRGQADEPGKTVQQEPQKHFSTSILTPTSRRPMGEALRKAVDDLRSLRKDVDDLRHRYLDDLENLSTRINQVTLRLHEMMISSDEPMVDEKPKLNSTRSRQLDATTSTIALREAAPPPPPPPPPAPPPPEPGAIPPAVNATKGLMRELRDAAQEATRERALPSTGDRLEQPMIDAIAQTVRDYLEEFVLMHTSLREAGDWSNQTMSRYTASCTTAYVAELLDPLEAAAREHQPELAESVVDYFAEIMALERIQVLPQTTPFDPNRHVSELADGRAKGTIKAVLRCGYMDARTQQVLRKTKVRLA